MMVILLKPGVILVISNLKDGDKKHRKGKKTGNLRE